MHITARTRPVSSSGAVRIVKPRIARVASIRAIRFCTVPREVLSFFAKAAAGSRALARSSARSLRSISSIILPSRSDETLIYCRIISVCKLFASRRSRSDEIAILGTADDGPTFVSDDRFTALQRDVSDQSLDAPGSVAGRSRLLGGGGGSKHGPLARRIGKGRRPRRNHSARGTSAGPGVPSQCRHRARWPRAGGALPACRAAGRGGDIPPRLHGPQGAGPAVGGCQVAGGRPAGRRRRLYLGRGPFFLLGRLWSTLH